MKICFVNIMQVDVEQSLHSVAPDGSITTLNSVFIGVTMTKVGIVTIDADQ